jgi:flavin reductase (DIM6/NTAB) family NADH-FMN oxidoreductase RutF
MNHYSPADLAAMDSRYRGNFINSLSGFKSVSLIGTANAQAQHNLAVFSNIVHIGASPALLGFVNRPRPAAPHTLGNIEATGSYTINHIVPSMVAQAHQTSAKYEAGISEFDATGLSALMRGGCTAPFVAESAVQMSMRLVEIVPIRHNGTFFVIGAVQDIYLARNDCVGADGFIELTALESIASLGMDAYYTAHPLARYAYAKPDRLATALD